MVDGVECNVLFICPAASQEERMRLRRDSMGVWRETKRRAEQRYSTSTFKKVSDKPTKNDLYVWKINFVCKAEPQLRRTEVFARKIGADGRPGEYCPVVVVQYLFAGKPKKVSVLPHGNSKGALPFHPSDPTLLMDIKSAAASQDKPSRIYNKVGYNDSHISILQNMRAI